MAPAAARTERRLTRPGETRPLGATVGADGINFAVHSSIAEAVMLCLFDERGHETAQLELAGSHDGTWHGFLPGASAGQHYGYRVHGPYRPSLGLRCNPHKLLIDPYAKALHGEFRWHPAVFGYRDKDGDGSGPLCELDSAPYVPKAVAVDSLAARPFANRVPWSKSILYELNVRGYTMRAPGLPAEDRGRFTGLADGDVVAYLKSLGITAVELMPVHYFIDEQMLVDRGLRNYWGYNTLNFFTPVERYGRFDARAEFIGMVDALHDAGLEVILDVVYNHTAEGDHRGPTLSFRGLDNAAWYRLTRDHEYYVNDTGCGNTIDADSPVVQDLVIDSLRYWVGEMGVDGFRFDLAPVLGRHHTGFDGDHPLLERIRNDALLKDRKLLAEPWDPGPGGYQLGAFGPPWSELNDRYRDTLRRFWRGDTEIASQFAERLHGSADIFEASGRGPHASVNFVANHDGFTLADTVAYERRHNEANGEDNRDGHAHNCSRNYGVEGPTDDEEILAVRRRQRLNMLATLLLSQGTPLLLAGDEFGHSQGGNNNAYAQDNETAWLDWSLLDSPDSLVTEVRELIALRRSEPLFANDSYLHGSDEVIPGWPDIAWLRPDGQPMQTDHWFAADAFTLLLGSRLAQPRALALLFNASSRDRVFELPDFAAAANWSPGFASFENGAEKQSTGSWSLPARSMMLFLAAIVDQ